MDLKFGLHHQFIVVHFLPWLEFLTYDFSYKTRLTKCTWFGRRINSAQFNIRDYNYVETYVDWVKILCPPTKREKPNFQVVTFWHTMDPPNFPPDTLSANLRNIVIDVQLNTAKTSDVLHRWGIYFYDVHTDLKYPLSTLILCISDSIQKILEDNNHQKTICWSTDYTQYPKPHKS